MELKFKNWTIKSGRKCFILTDGVEQWYYSSIENLLKSIPDKKLLKSEVMTKREILNELNEIRDSIKCFKFPKQ